MIIFRQIDEGMSRASLLVQGTTIATNAIDLTGTIVDSTGNIVDLTANILGSSTTINPDQPFDAEAKKDK